MSSRARMGITRRWTRELAIGRGRRREPRRTTSCLRGRGMVAGLAASDRTPTVRSVCGHQHGVLRSALLDRLHRGRAVPSAGLRLDAVLRTGDGPARWGRTGHLRPGGDRPLSAAAAGLLWRSRAVVRWLAATLSAVVCGGHGAVYAGSST